MGTKNIIGELQVNGSPVVTEDTVEEKAGLAGYVKKTDYATDEKAGLIRTSTYRGFGMIEGGYLTVLDADESFIGNRNTNWHDAYRRPMMYGQLDLAIKLGLTTNHLQLKDTEKASAQAWLGIDALVGDIEAAIDNIITLQNTYLGGES